VPEGHWRVRAETAERWRRKRMVPAKLSNSRRLWAVLIAGAFQGASGRPHTQRSERGCIGIIAATIMPAPAHFSSRTGPSFLIFQA